MKKANLFKRPNVIAMFILLLVFIGIDVVAMVAMEKGDRKSKAFYATAEQDTATFVDYVPDPNYKASDFCPRYQFTTKAGQNIIYVSIDGCVDVPNNDTAIKSEPVFIDPNAPQIVESEPLGTPLTSKIIFFGFLPLMGLVIFLITLFSERKKLAADL
jgi:hypothetical protein